MSLWTKDNKLDTISMEPGNDYCRLLDTVSFVENQSLLILQSSIIGWQCLLSHSYTIFRYLTLGHQKYKL